MEENERKSDEEILDEVENLINFGHYDEAQKKLLEVKADSGRRYFVEGKLYRFKGWLNESRKCINAAIKAEPENEEYRRALTTLEKLEKAENNLSGEKKQMGAGQTSFGDACGEGCAECCCAGSCECCAQGICEGLSGC